MHNCLGALIVSFPGTGRRLGTIPGGVNLVLRLYYSVAVRS